MLVLPQGIALEYFVLYVFYVGYICRKTGIRFGQQFGNDIIGIANGENWFVGCQVIEQFTGLDPLSAFLVHQYHCVGGQ